MLSNPYKNYYKCQAGTGIAGFQGVKYQRGHGFFGRLLSGVVSPLLKYLGKKSLDTGLNIAEDYLGGENLKTSAKRRLGESGKEVMADAVKRGRTFIQTGKGRKRRKTIKRTLIKRKKCRKTRRVRKKSVGKRTKKRTKRKRTIKKRVSKFDFLE